MKKYTKPTKALLDIIHGDIDSVNLIHKKVITGQKLSNKIFKKLVKEYRGMKDISDKIILNIFIALDEAIEKEVVTNDVLDYIKENPKFLKEILDKKNK